MVAALGQGRGGHPAIGVLEDEDAQRQGGLQIVLADNLAERGAELLEAHHGFAAGAHGQELGAQPLARHKQEEGRGHQRPRRQHRGQVRRAQRRQHA